MVITIILLLINYCIDLFKYKIPFGATNEEIIKKAWERQENDKAQRKIRREKRKYKATESNGSSTADLFLDGYTDNFNGGDAGHYRGGNFRIMMPNMGERPGMPHLKEMFSFHINLDEIQDIFRCSKNDITVNDYRDSNTNLNEEQRSTAIVRILIQIFGLTNVSPFICGDMQAKALIFYEKNPLRITSPLAECFWNELKNEAFFLKLEVLPILADAKNESLLQSLPQDHVLRRAFQFNGVCIIKI